MSDSNIEEQYCTVRIVANFSDGTEIELTGDDLMDGGFNLEDSVTDSSSFQIGNTIINKLKLTLNNYDGKFDKYDFNKATYWVWFGYVSDDDENITKDDLVKKGVFITDQPVANSCVINIEALDRMCMFDRDYSESKLNYPATLGAIVRDACNCCGVPLKSTSFNDSNMVIKEKPTEVTFREIISYAAQISVNNAHINADGELELSFFEFSKGENNIDGGSFKILSDESVPYVDGDKLEGGDFIHYYGGEIYDGGAFAFQDVHYFYDLYDSSISTDQVTITGFELTYEVKSTNEEESDTEKVITIGTNDYMYRMGKNPLIQENYEDVAHRIATRLIGCSFRPLTISTVVNPNVRAGEMAIVVDSKGNRYDTIIGTVTFQSDGCMKITAPAESESENESVRYSNVSKLVKEAVNKSTAKVGNYNQQMQMFSDLMINSMGFYSTKKEDEGGAVICYMHDQPTLESSIYIWKMSIDGFAVSLDGGKTYTYGITKDGNAVLNVLSATGVNADWITIGGQNNKDGVLDVKNASGSTIVSLGKDGVTLANGGKLIGGNGVLSTFAFSSGADQKIGYEQDYTWESNKKTAVIIDFYIPPQFVVTSAYIKLFHYPTATMKNSTTTTWGYCRNQRLYRSSNTMAKYFVELWMGDGRPSVGYDTSLDEVSGAFGSTGFTANYATSSSHGGQVATSTDIGAYITSGTNGFVIQTSNGEPQWQGDVTAGTAYQSKSYAQTGFGHAVLYVTGYMKP